MPKKALPKITTVVIEITPEMAAEFLTHNEHNRKPNQAYIVGLADDLRRGRYVFNGDPIRFDSTGKLIDGQHRLMAIVLSGVTVEWTVMRGLPPEAQDSIDTNRSRTVQDRLVLKGADNAALRGGIGRVLLGYRAGAVRTVAGLKGLSKTAVVAFAAVEDLDFGVLVGQEAARHKIGTPSVMGAAGQIAFMSDPSGAKEFFLNQVMEGVNLERDTPALLLRQRILSGMGRNSVPERSEMFWLVLKAFVQFQEGTRLQRLQGPKGGWSTENVPTPLTNPVRRATAAAGDQLELIGAGA